MVWLRASISGAKPRPDSCLGLFAERFGQSLFQLPDPAVEGVGSFAGGEQVGRAGRRGYTAGPGAGAGGRRGGVEGVDLLEQVAVPVEEACGRRRRRGRMPAALISVPSVWARPRTAMTRLPGGGPNPLAALAVSRWSRGFGLVAGCAVIAVVRSLGGLRGVVVVGRAVGMPRWTARVPAEHGDRLRRIAARSASLVWSRSEWMRVMSRRMRVISCWLGVASALGPVVDAVDGRGEAFRGCGAGRRGGRSGRAGRTRRCGSGRSRRSGTGPGRRRRRPARWMVRCTARRGRRPHRWA